MPTAEYGATFNPHPEERTEGPRLEGWGPKEDLRLKPGFLRGTLGPLARGRAEDFSTPRNWKPL